MAYTWYVETTGDNDNGGSSAGARKEQKTDVAVGGSGPYTFTSASNWTGAEVDDVIRYDPAGDDALLLVTDVTTMVVTATLISGSITPGGTNKTVNAGGAFADPGEAADAVAAGDHVYLKAGTYSNEHGSYGAILDLQTVGGTTAPIVWEGYKTTPGDADDVDVWFDDSYRAVFDASGLTGSDHCLSATGVSGNIYNTLRNIECSGCTNSTQPAAYLSDDLGVRFFNCKFSDNDHSGLYIGAYSLAVGCDFYDNSQSASAPALDLRGAGATAKGCRVLHNSNVGIAMNNYGCEIHGCLIVRNGSDAIDSNYPGLIVSDCTIEGDEKDDYGIVLTYANATIVNCLFYNCYYVLGGTGVSGAAMVGCMYGGYITAFTGGTPTEISCEDLGSGADADDLGFAQQGTSLQASWYRLTHDSPAISAGWPASRAIGWDQPGGVNADELHLVKAILCNKRTQNVATGVVTVYDDDGTTPVCTLTPSGDADAGEITVTPAYPNSGTPATAATEMHLVKAILANKWVQNVAGGIDTIKDDDGSTTLLTLTETEDSGVRTITPS